MDNEQSLKDICQRLQIDDVNSIEFAEAMDYQDPLKHLRSKFFYPKMRNIPNIDGELADMDEDCIYLCGNSLGLMPKKTKYLMDTQLDKWSKMGVLGHKHEPLPWESSDEFIIDALARLVGAKSNEVVLMNSLTINLHILLAAFYHPTTSRHKILIEWRCFPSDQYAIESQIRLKGYDVEKSLIIVHPRKDENILRNDDIISLIEQEGDSIAIIWFSGIHYYTGQLFDIQKITASGHSKGCLVGWDLAHSFANVPLSLHDWNVDFACWCTYKYACSGAGGIGAAFISERFKDDGRNRMLGWWSDKMETRFMMTNELNLDVGAAGYRISNPPMMLVVPVIGFFHVISKTSIEELRKKSIILTGYLEYLVNQWSFTRNAGKISCKVITPSDPEQRGCQLSLKFNCDVNCIADELLKRGVIVDKRYPDVIRVTPVHLYNSYKDVYLFSRVMVDLLKTLEESEIVSRLNASKIGD